MSSFNPSSQLHQRSTTHADAQPHADAIMTSPFPSTSTSTSPSTSTSTLSSIPTSKQQLPWHEAFNVLDHIKHVFMRRDVTRGRMNALDGYRAWLCLWMFAFHAIWLMGQFVREKEYRALGNRYELIWAITGYFPVDGFFILTGFLIAYPLFSAELNSNSSSINFSLHDIWYRRMIRILPLYYFFIWFSTQFIFPNDTMYPRSSIHSELFSAFFEKALPNDTIARPGATTPNLIANILLVNNLLPLGGYNGWTWSLAVQFQFYLWFPVMYIRLRSAIRTIHVCWCLLFVSVVYRIYSFFHLRNFHGEEVNGMVLVFWYYTNTFIRMPAILVGVMLAYYSLFTRFIEHLRSSRFLRNIISGLVIAIVCVQITTMYIVMNGYFMHIPLQVSFQQSQLLAPHQLTFPNITKYIHYLIYSVCFETGSILSACVFGWLFIITLNRIGSIGSVFNRIMSHPIWYPISTLSYSIYLFHPAIFIKRYSSIVGATNAPLSTDIFTIISEIIPLFIITFIFALLCHILIEKPIDVLLRSGSWPRATRYMGTYCTFACGASILTHCGATLVFSVLLPIDAPPAQQPRYGQ